MTRSLTGPAGGFAHHCQQITRCLLLKAPSCKGEPAGPEGRRDGAAGDRPDGERAGARRLSDGGGPFGFDIAVALLADEIIGSYECDAIAETGCFLGDTAAYLARRYPDLPVYTCDIDPGYSAFTTRRLAGCPNITVSCEDSPEMLARVSTKHKRPLAYLDAHWGEHWPLLAELDALSNGIALIHDFDIGHERFSFDTSHRAVTSPSTPARLCRGHACRPDGALGPLCSPLG